jgi:hypothetical protein
MSQTPRTLSPAVYRRRRIAVTLVLAVLVGLVWAGVNAAGSWFAASPAPEEVALPEGVNESSVVVESGQPCPPGTVSVMAQVGDSSGSLMNRFSADQTPHIWFTITNTNSVDCTFNSGPKVQYFTIKSGDQLIWTSRNCVREDLQDENRVLLAGETQKSFPSPWVKVFSSETGCGEGEAPVVTNGASYHVEAEVNGELSSNDQQFVLD